MGNIYLLGKDSKFISVSSKYFIIFIAIIFLIGYFSVLYSGYYNYQGEQIPIIVGDGYGYYFYLPFYIINYSDIHFDELLSPSEFEPFWNKYQVGEALMILPFFLIGHVLSIIFNYPLDGYSFLYQHAAGLSGLFYALGGIYILKKILGRYFSKEITMMTLLAVIFGTNLYHYGTLGSLFSHSFSFFLCSALIYLIPLWFENPKLKKNTIILGILAGFILLVRLPNILILLFVLFYKVNSSEDLRKRILFFIKNYKSLILIITLIFIIFLPQIITWKLTYNQWFVYSYGEARFHFNQLYISNVLFSLRRGLLFWSPILCFSIIGFWFMREKKCDYFTPSLLFISLITFINASFDRWWFGSSFGHRGFTEFLPVFALALAIFYSSLKNKNIKVTVSILSVLFVIYSMLQMILWWKGWIPHDLVTLLSYKNFFIKVYSYIKSFIQF